MEKKESLPLKITVKDNFYPTIFWHIFVQNDIHSSAEMFVDTVTDA